MLGSLVLFFFSASSCATRGRGSSENVSPEGKREKKVNQ